MIQIKLVEIFMISHCTELHVLVQQFISCLNKKK
jgi:hypothetical protein